jgi:hypothetical protein
MLESFVAAANEAMEGESLNKQLVFMLVANAQQCGEKNNPAESERRQSTSLSLFMLSWEVSRYVGTVDAIHSALDIR